MAAAGEAATAVSSPTHKARPRDEAALCHACAECGAAFDEEALLELHQETQHGDSPQIAARDIQGGSWVDLDRSEGPDLVLQQEDQQEAPREPQIFRSFDGIVRGRRRGVAPLLDSNASAVACLHLAQHLLEHCEGRVEVTQALVDNLMDQSNRFCREQAYAMRGDALMFDPVRNALDRFPALELVPLVASEEPILREDQSATCLSKIVATLVSLQIANDALQGVCALINCGLETMLVFAHERSGAWLLFDPAVRAGVGFAHDTPAVMRFATETALLDVLDRVFFPVFCRDGPMDREVREHGADMMRFWVFRRQPSGGSGSGHSFLSGPSPRGLAQLEHANDRESLESLASSGPSSGSLSGLQYAGTECDDNDTDDTEDGGSGRGGRNGDGHLMDDWLLTRAKAQLHFDADPLGKCMRYGNGALRHTLLKAVVDVLWCVPEVRSQVLVSGLGDSPGSLVGSLRALFFGMEQGVAVEAARFALLSLARAAHDASPLSFSSGNAGHLFDAVLRRTAFNNMARFKRVVDKASGAQRRVVSPCIADLFSFTTERVDEDTGEVTSADSFVHHVPAYRLLPSLQNGGLEAALAKLLRASFGHADRFACRNSLLLFLPRAKSDVVRGAEEDIVSVALSKARSSWRRHMPQCDLDGSTPDPDPVYFVLRSKAPVVHRDGSRRRVHVAVSKQPLDGLVGAVVAPGAEHELSLDNFECYLAAPCARDLALAWLSVLLLAEEGDAFYVRERERVTGPWQGMLLRFVHALGKRLASVDSDNSCTSEWRRYPAQFFGSVQVDVDAQGGTSAAYRADARTGMLLNGALMGNLLLDKLHVQRCGVCSEADVSVQAILKAGIAGGDAAQQELYECEKACFEAELARLGRDVQLLLLAQPFEYLKQRLASEAEWESQSAAEGAGAEPPAATHIVRHALLRRPSVLLLALDWSRSETAAPLWPDFAPSGAPRTQPVFGAPGPAEIKLLLRGLSGPLDLEEVFRAANPASGVASAGGGGLTRQAVAAAAAAAAGGPSSNLSFWQMTRELFELANEPALLYESLRKATNILASSRQYLPKPPALLRRGIKKALEDALGLFCAAPEWAPVLEMAVRGFEAEMEMHERTADRKTGAYHLTTLVAVQRVSDEEQRFSVYTRRVQHGRASRAWFALTVDVGTDELAGPPAMDWPTLVDHLHNVRACPVLAVFSSALQDPAGPALPLQASPLERVEADFADFGQHTAEANLRRLGRGQRGAREPMQSGALLVDSPSGSQRERDVVVRSAIEDQDKSTGECVLQ